MGVNGIYGLSGSGLDIESMVKVGMMSKQNEYDKMAQKYTKNEWTKNALIEINNQITTFNMSSLSDYKMSSKMNARTATSSNEAAVTATANATSAIMSHKVSVNSLSHNAYLIGSNKISTIIEGTLYNGTTTAVDESKVNSLASNAYLKDILFKDLTYNNEEAASYQYNPDNSTTNLTQQYTIDSNQTLTVTTAHNGTKSFEYNDGTTTYTGGVVDSSNSNVIGFNGGYSQGGITLNLNPSTITGRDFASATVSKGYDTSTQTGGSTINYDVGNVEEKLSFSSSANGNQTITINTDASGNKTASYTSDKSAYGTVNYNGNGTVSGNSITFNNGTTINFYLSARCADVKEQTRGVTGSTMNSYGQKNDDSYTIQYDTDGSYVLTGSRSNLVSSYNSGNGTLAQLKDTAIEFTIADSTDADATTATIKFTYGDLLGSDSTKPKSMNDLVSEINSKANNAGINVKAAYDNVNGVFSIYNPTSDDKSSVVIKAATSNSSTLTDSNALSFQGQATMNFFNALGLKAFDGTALSSAKLVSGDSSGTFKETGSNGEITVDGMAYKTKDNKVTVGGVTYNALSSTEDATGVNRPATVTVGQDVDAIVDRVKSFVESYNKILGSLYEKYDEKSDSNYKPLTQAQKDQMKDEQVEKWEEKAKKGLLYHDQTLSKIIGQMRNAISAEVEGTNSKYTSAYSIGISTTGIKGQLVLDETKLRNALAEDGDSVYNVFGKLTMTTDSTGKSVTDYNKSGVAQRLGDIFTDATKLIKNRAGSSSDIAEDSDLNNLLRELQTKMSNFKKLMDAFEDRLYKKYDAMEVTLSKLGSQLNFITGGQ